MDIIKDFAQERESINIFDFFQQKYQHINLRNTQIQLNSNCWEDLQTYWIQVINDFITKNPKKNVVKNYYKVDWEELYNLMVINKNKRKLRASIIQEHTSMTSSITDENLFIAKSEPNLANIIYIEKIRTAKKEMKHESDMWKQDLLYYNILDFVSKSENNYTKRVLGDDYIFFKNKYNVDLKKNKLVGDLVKEVFDSDNDDQTLKKILKAKKKGLTDLIGKKALNKKIIKSLKVYDRLFKEDRYPELSEDEYLYLFIRPLIKIILKDVKSIKIICGESNLRCASKRQNQKLFDDERRNPGPRIDIIFTHKLFKQEVSILEISGPNHKIDNNHFLGDRNKIAKNLKHILITIISSFPPCSAATVKRLKVYGFQLYDDIFYVYSLSTTNNNSYIFSLESKFNIPMTPSTLKQNSPLFFSKLWLIKGLFIQVENQIKELQEKSFEYSIISTDSDSSPSSSPPSPKKKAKNKK